MNPLIPRVGTAAAAVIGAAALVAAGPHDVTRPRLEKSLDATFVNLYLEQQHRILGHAAVTAASTGASTTCHRTASSTDVGAGPDWVCHVLWRDDKGAKQDGKFEVAAKANYCYVASGPSKIVGLQTIADTTGRQVPNPLFEFDACYDPAS
ncbi:hypothetical protein EV189_3101 [Motilibacter rhizosphaerae]|uniref:Uncharacterized protein n=1 Tax=Motilibacter rhizosphaerae TaxID=598652 RepID=A0A4Q7NGY3_9ACTN|nr:hypothetical protein [Motilibacter rhizosphaerae]RZS82706.1 hypothetical protein EV189_3101 [Motilibacter rhizosphaerae]